MSDYTPPAEIVELCADNIPIHADLGMSLQDYYEVVVRCVLAAFVVNADLVQVAKDAGQLERAGFVDITKMKFRHYDDTTPGDFVPVYVRTTAPEPGGQG